MIALITGASGGLGRAMAVECALRGYDLFLTDLDTRHLEEIQQGIQHRFNVDVYIKACDLTDADEVSELFRYIDDQSIQLNMLLGIAGIDFEGSFMGRECDKVLDIVKLNVEATLRVTHAALTQRNPDERFYVAIVSSLASMYPIPLKATYAASKRFLLDFSIALRQELKRENVNVLALCPGGLPTTQEALSGIAAQGFWGNMTTNSLSMVAHKTISKVLAGKSKYIPGIVNNILTLMSKLVPKTLIAKLLYKKWETAQKKWLAVKKA